MMLTSFSILISAFKRVDNQRKGSATTEYLWARFCLQVQMVLFYAEDRRDFEISLTIIYVRPWQFALVFAETGNCLGRVKF